MPGHKGNAPYDSLIRAVSQYDITEITGADALFEAQGIIGASEQNASSVFGSKATLYSTQGSTLAIQTMIYLIFLHGGRKILAGRNAHHAFLHVCELLGMDVNWLLPPAADAYGICGMVTPDQVEQALKEDSDYGAVYITSPDYLGNTADILGISRVCRQYGVPLLCDNAHGAYLKFSTVSRHPLDLGASLCCDSAHKTFPVLTGGAYLHIAQDTVYSKEEAKEAMNYFSSTSPSYLILTSLDLCNRYLAEQAKSDFIALQRRIQQKRKDWQKKGICFLDSIDDFSKITIDAGKIGWNGNKLQEWLEKHNILCEYANDQYVVLMASPFLSEEDWERLDLVLNTVEIRPCKQERILSYGLPERAFSMTVARGKMCETVLIEDSVGRISAQTISSCPPGVPVVVAGEIITDQIKNICKNSRKFHIKVVK
jgi:arginine decarboxylase